ELHSQLAADTVFLEDWPLSRVLLLNDARYAWLVLVPRRMGLSELHDVTPADRVALTDEVMRASESLKRLTGAAKINTGALGNLVPQLHIHVVARAPGDPAWPGPVWGHSPAQPYSAAALEQQLVRLRGRL
ncbi:MAG TPA: HIT family protein, partial [Rhizomicrobium sp.]|nr:HIT family protein [Rhizomicrobium sp.]